MKIYGVGYVDKFGSVSLAYFSTLVKARKFKRDNAFSYREELYISEVEVDKECK